MTRLTLKSSIGHIKGVGPKTLEKLKLANIRNIKDLLLYFPYRFEDYTHLVKINDIRPDRSQSFTGQITNIRSSWAPRKRMTIVSAIAKDESGSIKITWYNNRYILRYIKKNNKYIFLGKAILDKNGYYVSNPLFYSSDRKKQIKYIFPVYSEIAGIKSKWFIDKISQVLHLAEKIKDPIPKEILKKQNLMPLTEAITKIHNPQKINDIKKARRRLGFDEVFFLQLKSVYLKNENNNLSSRSVKKNIEFVKKQLKHLPFKLTNSQKKSLWEIIQDIEKKHPMNRLLEGDVGSGKTVVAALCMSIMAENNYQSLLIAPTEILALQHWQKIKQYLKHNSYTIGLLTSKQIKISHNNQGENIDKKELIKKMGDNQINILVGTHAIWHTNAKFKNINLVVIDEQHRFGVKQRNNFYQSQKKYIPHHLSMSATPIPRSLALTIYGHLSLSQIKSLPYGRKPITTSIIRPNQRDSCYSFARQQVKSGKQAYIIYPLVEESNKIQAKSAKQEYNRLQKYIFPDLKLGLLHGQLKSEEKARTLQRFQANQINILVATSVIEVGIDIPNANIIIIEGSERFGLSQLHQLRGRVGRGLHQSYCFLFSNQSTGKAINRLEVLVETNDGFQIAEADLKLRGPGELSGLKQSGIPDLKMASLSDQELIEHSYMAAQNIIDQDPKLKKHPLLKKKVKTKQLNLS